MTFEYMISTEQPNDYLNKIILSSEYNLYFNDEKYLTEVEINNKKIFCYGYCFDVRDPELTTKKTLENLISNENFNQDLTYLNGQYVIMYCKDEDEILLAIDASSLVPVYVYNNFSIITTEQIELEDSKIFNPNYMVNLNEKSICRIKANYDFYDKDYILSLVKNQYKYFYNKNILLNFKSNKYMKALISIMKPVLYGNYMMIDEPEKNSELNFGNEIAKDFSMELIDEIKIPEIENIIYLRNQLLDFTHFIKDDTEIKLDNFIMGDDYHELPSPLKIAELNMLNRKREQSKELNKKGMLFDPFNSHSIYQYLIMHSGIEKDITNTITESLLPSINYYDFLNGETLKEINISLNDEIESLKSKQMTAQNEQFLLNTKSSYFNVSDNLNGKLKKNEITIYPASQSIKANEKYTISYENPGDGLIYIKSFYKNQKNGQTIEVTVNNKVFSIDEFSSGLLFNVKSKLKITLKYKNARNSLPWQKAGTLLIRKK